MSALVKIIIKIFFTSPIQFSFLAHNCNEEKNGQNLICHYMGLEENVFCELIQEMQKYMQKWKSERCTFFIYIYFATCSYLFWWRYQWKARGQQLCSDISWTCRPVSVGRRCFGISSSYLWICTIRKALSKITNKLKYLYSILQLCLVSVFLCVS